MNFFRFCQENVQLRIYVENIRVIFKIIKMYIISFFLKKVFLVFLVIKVLKFIGLDNLFELDGFDIFLQELVGYVR